MCKYVDRKAWQEARSAEWDAKSPVTQKLTKKIIEKGAKLYSVSVNVDDYGRYKAEVSSWSVTSFRRYRTVSEFSSEGVFKVKVPDLKLFIKRDGFEDWKETLQFRGNIGEESLPDIYASYFSTPRKAFEYALKRNKHDLKWVKLRPPSTEDTEWLDEMFSLERYEREMIALRRLEKRMKKSV